MMCAVAKFFELQPSDKKNLLAAVQQASSSRPACSPYMKAVGDFVGCFGGGGTFPLLMLLQSISHLVD